ncbi:MAG: PQQ-binding-like beta-propeller repeat protein [Streptosporangiaceae bacterium]
MKVARGRAAWARRVLLAVVLIGAAVIPGRASSQLGHGCHGVRCKTPGAILWARPLPGSWLAQPGVAGTVPAQGSAYAATDGHIAVLGSGLLVSAFQAATGKPRWQATLGGLPLGSQIVGVRVFAGVVAVGAEPTGSRSPAREEVILSAATGQRIRTYPAAADGGAIAADKYRTVVVGAHAVTAYANGTGRILWSRATGRPAEAWRVAGQYVYVTRTSHGYLSSAPVTALLRIGLRTGAQKILRPTGSGFPAGTLSGAVVPPPGPGRRLDGVVLFSSGGGVWAFSGDNAEPLWHLAPAALELTDARTGTVYLAIRGTLTAVSPATGAVLSVAADSVLASLYSVNGGVALGLDEGALGDAWGYSPVRKKVVWTSKALPWPHFFVDLSGLGGSDSPANNIVLLATCAQVGGTSAGTPAAACLKPELTAVLA